MSSPTSHNWYLVTETEDISYTCPVCNVKKVELEIHCQGAEERGEKKPTILVCDCTSEAQYYCVCGNPCK